MGLTLSYLQGKSQSRILVFAGHTKSLRCCEQPRARSPLALPDFLLPGLLQGDCRWVLGVPLEGRGGVRQLLRESSPAGQSR